MSYQAVSWALYDAPQLLTDKGLPDSTARFVLAAVAEHANDTGGNAHPSPLRIHFATGFDVRTIDRALRRLEAGKLLERTGVHFSGTTIYQCAMHMRRAESEWETLKADAEKIKKAESAKRKARRHRQASMNTDHVRDAESRMSGTENAGVRDAESRMSGTQRPPNHQEEPPTRTTLRTTPGGAPPPDPRGHEDPSGLRTEKPISFSEPQDQHQDLISNHRPRARTHAHAHTRENQDPTNPVHSTSEPRVNNHGSPNTTEPQRVNNPGSPTFLAPPATPRVNNHGEPNTKPREESTANTTVRETCPHGRSTRRRKDGTPRCPECTTPAAPHHGTTAAVIRLQPARCPHGLPNRLRPDQSPQCPLCRREPAEVPDAAP